MDKIKQLIDAESKAKFLFETVEKKKLIQAGKTEKQLNQEVYDLAFELFGIKKYWHKRIVRAGKNTLLPYKFNPENLTLQESDIVFFDFGPVFEDWEADFGRTYVIGEDKTKIKLAKDVENAWYEGKKFYDLNRETLTGSDLYFFTKNLATKFGWEYGNEHCGHLIGNFPHEKLLGEEKINYLHPENQQLLSELDKFGKQRFWIYEIHFVDVDKQIGGFYEQLLF